MPRDNRILHTAEVLDSINGTTRGLFNISLSSAGVIVCECNNYLSYNTCLHLKEYYTTFSKHAIEQAVKHVQNGTLTDKQKLMISHRSDLYNNTHNRVDRKLEECNLIEESILFNRPIDDTMTSNYIVYKIKYKGKLISTIKYSRLEVTDSRLSPMDYIKSKYHISPSGISKLDISVTNSS